MSNLTSSRFVLHTASEPKLTAGAQPLAEFEADRRTRYDRSPFCRTVCWKGLDQEAQCVGRMPCGQI